MTTRNKNAEVDTAPNDVDATLETMNPTWEDAVRIYIDVLQNPRATAGATIGAKEDLLRLARNFETAKAHIGKLQEALDEATNPQRKEK